MQAMLQVHCIKNVGNPPDNMDSKITLIKIEKGIVFIKSKFLDFYLKSFYIFSTKMRNY